ncbi:MAG: hypothetical protein KDA37_05285 [Planctomycetales bacterium]|nr:hypothetical protein [Planctomycetales bacterium]
MGTTVLLAAPVTYPFQGPPTATKRFAMQYLLDKINDAPGDTWAWFNSLSRDEWFIVLGVVTLLGFLCMRGFGSRSTY